MPEKDKPKGKGVRSLGVNDRLPETEIRINEPVYNLSDIFAGKKVADIGCGYGRNRKVVEAVGGEWVGVEPFEGGAHTVTTSAGDLPFEDESFDVVVMDAVLEHIPNIASKFRKRLVSESWRLFRRLCGLHGMLPRNPLFAFVVHGARTLHENQRAEIGTHQWCLSIRYRLSSEHPPLPVSVWLVAGTIRSVFRLKAAAAYLMLRMRRRLSHNEAGEKARSYYLLECLRQSNGFNYVIRKPIAETA